MTRVGDVADKIRSKNAGPFWLTIDIFCPDDAAYLRLRDGLSLGAVAQATGAEAQNVKRFDLPDLRVVKFSLPRPEIQGSPGDRDMHGASWGPLIAELPLD